jgi:ligand-binding sensor domain-containing protein
LADFYRSRRAFRLDTRILFADREGNLWAGSTKGLHFINPEPAVRVFSKATGLPADNVYSVIEDRSGTIWFGAWNDWLINYRNGRFASEFSRLSQRFSLIVILASGRMVYTVRFWFARKSDGYRLIMEKASIS